MKNKGFYIVSLIYFVATYFFITSQANQIGVFKNTQSNYKELLAIGMVFNMVLFFGITSIILPKFIHFSSLKKSLIIVGLYFIGITLIETILDYFLIEEEKKDAEFWQSLTIIEFTANFFYLFAGSAIGFTTLWYRNERQKRQLIEENLKSQLQILKSQIQPHFLFNVLNLAYGNSLKNKDTTTANIILDLSEMMRYVLYESEEKYVSLEKEIDYIKSYIALQKRRFSSNESHYINCSITVDDPSKWKIAPMLLINFIENAFKHGLIEDQKTFIDIQIHINEEGWIYFLVKNLKKKPAAKNQLEVGGIGLENIKKRLKLLYPNAYTFNISEDDQWYEVNFNLKLR